jgi:inorganic pyrophosphatase
MKVFIQNEAGSFVKNYHDEKTPAWRGSVRVSRAYPFPYRFVLATTLDDGLNADCFVITKAGLGRGQIIERDPIALMEQIEDGKEDHNVVAVMRREEQKLDGEKKRMLTEFVSHVFDRIPGKTVRTSKFRGREAALKYVAGHRDSKTSRVKRSGASGE